MPRGRPREFDTEKALDTAMLLFWKHGYEGTSLAALTDSMGINVPSLYAAFGNKEELFRKAVARYIQKPASYLPTALKEPTARRAAEKLLSSAIKMVMYPGHPDGCLLVHGALASGPSAEFARKELSRCRAGAESAVRGRFERAIAEGDLPPSVDATKLARYIVTVIWGLSVQAAGGATRAQLKEVAELALQCWPESTTPAAPLQNLGSTATQ
jgi:AcrR family transcriptional regulator